ncbi:thioesterase II family protein [Arenibaculum sp.]|uniref:thioesterase II family protein n=1 Tax=Arenibaculum sp. TaxID=2865862 RepID=UPI002E122A58|nr:alpha/beta fold hydrolase [Arenibaculum sp.]
MRAASDPWFVTRKKKERPALRLFCFPYAGGGPHIFSDWADHLPDAVEVVGVRLPGRENRFRERPYRTWEPLTADLTALVRAKADAPFALFGHSLGGRIAYEVAKRLEASGREPARQVIVSGCRAPTTAQRQPPMYSMTTPDLRRRLHEMQGVPAEILRNENVMTLIEPTLRADLELAETWASSPEPVAAPVAAFCGTRDAVDPPAAMRPWYRATTGRFDYAEFDGGHFFIHDHEAVVLARIAGLLEQSIAEGRGHV